MKVIGYARVSSVEQMENTSLEAQKKAMQDYCRLKNFDLVAICQDAGVSGSKPLCERKEGGLFVEAINKGIVQGVLITKLDRAFRDTIDCLQNVRAWENQGISLHIIDLGGASVDTASPSGRFTLTVLAAAAEMERARIQERCNEGRRARRQEGKRIGEIPYGYDLEYNTNKLVENNGEQEVVRFIRDLRSSNASLRFIAKTLNQKHLTKKGRSWRAQQVANILKRVV